MISISDQPLDSEDFRKQMAKATVAHADLLEIVSKSGVAAIDISNSVYGGFKSFLQKTHNHKCAYCESKIETEYGAVEHYRPKNGVRSKDGLESDLDEHPGYYWVAYDWENFLLSCTRCNTTHKGTLFPIAGRRAVSPTDELSVEEPLILNPTKDEPREYLSLDESGNLTAKNESPRGISTIEVLGLNRETLIENRQSAIEKGHDILFDFIDAVKNKNIARQKKAWDKLKAVSEQTDPYNMASTYGLVGALKSLKEKNMPINISAILSIPIAD